MTQPHAGGLEAAEGVGRLVHARRRDAGGAARACFAVGLLAVTVYFLLPGDPQSVLFVAVAASAAAAIVVGARLNLIENRMPWYLFAGGQLAFAGGDSVFAYYEIGLGREPPFPSTADGIYLAGYALLIVATFLLIRGLTQIEGQFAVIDATIIAIGFGLVQWVFVIHPHLDEHVSVFEKLALIAYPAMDALLLGALARFFLTGAWRARAYWYLVVAIVLLLTADEFYAVAPDAYAAGTWIDALWIGSYVFWAAAALDPSMARLSETRDEGEPLSWTRLGLMTAALLAAPVVVVIEVSREERFPALVAFTASAILAILVLLRALGFDAYVFEHERRVRAQHEAMRRLGLRIRRVGDDVLVVDIGGSADVEERAVAAVEASRAEAVVVDLEDVDRAPATIDRCCAVVDAAARLGKQVVVVGADDELTQALRQRRSLDIQPDLGSGIASAERLLRAAAR